MNTIICYKIKPQNRKLVTLLKWHSIWLNIVAIFECNLDTCKCQRKRKYYGSLNVRHKLYTIYSYFLFPHDSRTYWTHIFQWGFFFCFFLSHWHGFLSLQVTYHNKFTMCPLLSCWNLVMRCQTVTDTTPILFIPHSHNVQRHWNWWFAYEMITNRLWVFDK